MSNNQTATMKIFLSRIVTACALLLAFAATATATTFTVTTTNDSGAGSLRAAIAGAAPNDTIVFHSSLSGQTITLAGYEIPISRTVTIDATGLLNGIVLTGGSQVYGGSSNLRPFQVNAGTLTLRHVRMTGCGGVRGSSALAGGAIRVSGTGALQAFDCYFNGNTAEKSGGAISCSSTSASLSLTRCSFVFNGTLTDNGASGAGGAVTCTGNLYAVNCTFTRNYTASGYSAGNSAAAIHAFVGVGAGSPPAMFLTHCTIAGNNSGSNGTAIQAAVIVEGSGAGFNSTCTITNCIIAANNSSATSAAITDVRAQNNGNLYYKGGNLVQSSLGPIVLGAITQTGNPLLGELAANGGLSQTMALLVGSPAINAGVNLVGTIPATDQRGFSRVQDGNGSGTGAGALPDLGAYESQYTPASIGFNFVGGGPAQSLGASERAGVPTATQANWNNLTGNYDGTGNGSYTAGPAVLKDATGASFSPNLKLWWAASNTYSISGSTQTTPDTKLMNGYLDSDGSGDGSAATNLYGTSAPQPFFSVSGLPASLAFGGYKVIVYADGDANDGRIARYWLAGNNGQNPANVANETRLTADVFIRDLFNFTGTYWRSAATSDAGAVTAIYGNYVQFDARTENGFTVRAEESSGSGLRAPINAMQIVRNQMIVVTTLADENDPIGTPGAGVSLREALRDAPDGAGIIFDSSLSGGTITFGSSINIAKNVTIDASNLPGGITLSGGGTVLPLTVSSGFSASLNGLTMANGYVDYDGGAVFNAGTMVATHCTFSGNTAGGIGGGGIGTTGPLTLNNCIVAGNTTTGFGPDIRKFGSGSVIRLGTNLIGKNESVSTEFPTGPLVGTTAAPVLANLGPLASNGGPTRTLKLLPGSPAINTVPLASMIPGILTDQRGSGFPRQRGPFVDVGAMEFGVTPQDLNNDGLPDIVLQNPAGQVFVWYMNGSGVITGGAFIYNAALSFAVVGAADMNGDGQTDIILQNAAGQVFVWYMNGITITSGAFIYSGGTPFSVR
jgi:predicted outer membrane repeat protein